MKITGKILTQKTMAEMKVGESGFLQHSAITLINREFIMINTNYTVTPYQMQECVVPIIRTGNGPEEYEINMFINQSFFNSILTEKEIEEYKNDNKEIGPYPIEVEILDLTGEVDQVHPRMTWKELLEDFVIINEPIVRDELSENEVNLLINEKQIVIEHMTKYIDKMSLEVLECFQDTFKPMNDPKDPEAYNRYEDEDVDALINSRIKSLKKQQTLEDMSIEELETKKKKYIAQERFEDAERIKQIINTKKIQQTQ